MYITTTEKKKLRHGEKKCKPAQQKVGGKVRAGLVRVHFGVRRKSKKHKCKPALQKVGRGEVRPGLGRVVKRFLPVLQKVRGEVRA